MDNVAKILYECEKMDMISVDDLSYAEHMLSDIGIKQKNTPERRKRNIDCLDQMYQYWGLHSI